MNLKDLNEASSNTSNEVSVKDIILKVNEWYRYIKSKWLVIVLFGILGAFVGLGIAYLKKPVYIASTTFVLEDGEKGGGLGQYAGLASMVGLDIGGGGGGIFQGDNILELYKSRTMIEKTLLTTVIYQGKKELLVDHYISFNKLRAEWDKKAALRNISFDGLSTGSGVKSRLQDSLLGTIVKDINKNYLIVSKPDKKTSIINAVVRAKDEFFAKTFNDQIVKNVNDFYIQTKTKKSLLNVAILQQKTDSVRAVMNGAIYSAAVVVDNTPNLNPTRQAQRAAPMQRSQFNAEANKVVLAELVKNLELSKMALRKETPLIQVVDAPVLPLDKEKLSKMIAVLIGGIVFSFITGFFLIARRIFRKILN